MKLVSSVLFVFAFALCLSADAKPNWFWSFGGKTTSTTLQVRTRRSTNAVVTTKSVDILTGRHANDQQFAKILAGPKSIETFIFAQEEVQQSSLSQQDIPFDLIQRMSEVEDVEEFLKYVTNVTVVPIEGQEPLLIGSWEDPQVVARAGGSGRDSSAITAKNANCMPELQTVELIKPTDTTVFYYPACTRIERCGGCCASELLTCEPTRTEMVNLKVIKTQYTGGDKMKFAGNEIIAVEKHISCKCVCRIKESDCHGLQTYNVGGCKCDCNNWEDRDKCLLESPSKIWNPAECACKCKEQMFCSTGSFYDQQSCKCEPFPSRKGFPARLSDTDLQRAGIPTKSEQEESVPDPREKANKPYVSFQFEQFKIAPKRP